MTNTKKYELVVVGGGSAGSTAAKWAVRRGISVALVERDRLGGTCLNYGCDPTKALLHAAGLLHAARAADSLGLRFPDAGFDWHAVMGHVREIIEGIRGGGPEDAIARQEERGIDVLLGEASFISPQEIRVGDDVVMGGRFLIATGFEPDVPPIPGLSEAGYITNREAVALERLPKSMAVIGAGPMGVEFAQMLSRFGVRVSLCEMQGRILPKDEADLAIELAECLRGEGVQVHCDAKIEGVEKRGSGEKRIVWSDEQGGEHTCDVEEILMASGRKPALEGLGLEQAGVAMEEGALVLEDTLRTSVPSIYAAGDITGDLPFTHAASMEGLHAVRNAFSTEPEVFDYRAVPWVTYSEPALAHVGATTQLLQETGRAFKKLEVAFGDIPRNIVTESRAGRVRMLVEPETGEILGGHILGAGAGELIAPIVVAMRHKLPVEALAESIFPYPTSVEAIQFAAGQF